MLKKIKLFALASTLGVIAVTAPATAQTTTVTFGSSSSGSLFTGTVTEGGVKYSTYSGSLFLSPRGNSGRDLEGTASDGGGFAIFQPTSGLFTFAGIDFAAYAQTTAQQTITLQGYFGNILLGTDTYMINSTTNSPPFGTPYDNWTTFTAQNLAGVVLDSLRISLPASTNPFAYTAIDNVRFTSAVTPAVPEPASWALMIVGMGAVGLAMRRKGASTRVSCAV